MDARIKKGIAGSLAGLSMLVGGVVVADKVSDPYEKKEGKFEMVLSEKPNEGTSRVKIHEDKPLVEFEKWDDGTAFSISYGKPEDAFGVGRRKALTDRIEWGGLKEEVHAYPLPESGVMEDGGFEIEVVLPDKPESNVFDFTVEGAEEFDFFYQGELTAKEIAAGDTRPENVVGSYAVYHKTNRDYRAGGINYKSGKAFHVFRPKAIDADGVEVWADLHHEEGVLSVTVPQKFLDTAAYPVRVDPTFGYTSVGVSGCTVSSAAMTGNIATLPEDGVVSGITANVSGSWAAAETLRGAIYNSGGTYTGNETNELTTGGTGWFDFTVTPVELAAADYRLNLWTSGSLAIACDSGSSGQTFDSSLGASYPSWPTINGLASANIKSIYATYEEVEVFGPAGCEFLQSANSTTDTDVYTFSSQNVGTAAADRYIVVTTGSRKAGAAATLSSVTVGGVTATIVEQVTNNVTNTDVAGIAIAAVPTGTTGDVVVTWSTTMLRSWIGMYRLDNLATSTPYDFGESVAADPTMALDTTAGGCAIGGAMTAAGTTATWVGLTENFDATVESFVTYTGGASSTDAEQVGMTVTADFAGVPVESAGVFASWSGAAVEEALETVHDIFWFN